MKNLNFFSERVKQLRIDNNLSQPVLGKAVGLSKQAINDMEHGRSKTTLDKAMIIADYFNVSIDYLVGRTNTPEVNK
ncbi:MAG: helix-turn-helix domain-containing protein [Oscillospiraceae bacterium]|nr:helix-turn-helix domain-containing protein [Oscillospiraceae bacterium]